MKNNSQTTPGWVYILGAKKWHYIDAEGRTLCRRYLYLGCTKPEEGNNESPDNCKGCRKALNKKTQNKASQ